VSIFYVRCIHILYARAHTHILEETLVGGEKHS